MENFADILFQRRFNIKSNLVLNLEYSYDDLPEILKDNKKNALGLNWAAVSEAIAEYGQLLIESTSKNIVAVMLDFASFIQYGAYGLRALEHLIMKALTEELPVIIDSRVADYKGSDNAIVGNAFIGYVPGWDGWQPSNVHAHAMSIMPYKGKQMVEHYLEICLRMQRGLLLLLDREFLLEWDWLAKQANNLLGNKLDRSGLIVYLEDSSLDLVEKIYKTNLTAFLKFPEEYNQKQIKNFWNGLHYKTKSQSFITIGKEELDYLKINNIITRTNIDSAKSEMDFVNKRLEIYKEMFYQ